MAAKGSWSGELSNRRKDGSESPANLTVDTYLAHAYGERRRVALIHDMTEKRQAKNVIRHQATFDALTDLPNPACSSIGWNRRSSVRVARRTCWRCCSSTWIASAGGG